MEQPKTQPVNPAPYGSGGVPAEAQQYMEWAREQFARLSPALRGKYADTWALGFISSTVAEAMRGREVPQATWAKQYAIYLVAQESGRP